MQVYARIFLGIILICFILSWNLIDIPKIASNTHSDTSDSVLDLKGKDESADKMQGATQKTASNTDKESVKSTKKQDYQPKDSNKPQEKPQAKVVVLSEKQRRQEDSITLQQEQTAIAKILAALPTNYEPYKNLVEEKSTKLHYTEFEKAWQNLQTKRLDKIISWRDAELKDINKKNNQTLFYPFSGPDFLNAYTLFPHCDYYLLFGLERIGELPKKEQQKGQAWANYLVGVRQALSEIFDRNYFITSRMSATLNGGVKGVLPLIAIFLSRTENEILSIQRVYLDKQGNPTYTSLHDYSKQGLSGLYIVFLHKNKDKAQRMFYFGTDLSDGAMPNKRELVQFIKAFDNKITLIKSASYLLHTQQFSTIRNLVLEETNACLQDDTGVPYNYFVKNNWDIQLYGKYARPVKDFNYGYQLDLQKKFDTDTNIKPIDFTFGYHWWTDKSSILFCQKKAKSEKPDK